MSEYIEKYSWLRTNSLYSEADNSDYDVMDFMPEGWRIAFGDLLCEELDAAIKNAGVEDEFSVYEVKEKYGRLVVYTSHDYIEEIAYILNKYSAISSHICIKCGKPDVQMIKIGTCCYCYCDDCYDVLYGSVIGKNAPYKYAGDVKIPNTVTMGRIRDGSVKKIVLKDTADRIRARWAEREIGRS